MSSKSVVSEITNSQNGFFGGRAEGQITGVKVLTIADLEKMWVCAGTTADYAVYLPKPSECAGKIVGFRMDPGLTKLVTLDAGQTDNVKTGTVQVWTGSGINITYPMEFPSTSYTGVNWKPSNNNYYALGVIRLGDRLNWNNAYVLTAATRTYSRYIATLSTDNSVYSTMSASFTWTSGLTYTSDPVTVDHTGIVGTNTTFLTDLTVGGLIWVGGESRTVAWIGDDTHCAVTVPFTNAGSGLTYSASGTPYTIDGPQTRIMWANEVAILYSDGYKWTKIAGKSIPMMASLRLNANQTAAAGAQTIVAFDSIIADHTNCPSGMTAQLPYIVALRPGKYHVDVTIQINDDNASASYNLVNVGTTSLGVLLWHYEQTKTANTRVVRQVHTNIKVLAAGDKFVARFRYDSGSSAKCLQGFTEQGYVSNNFSVEEIPTW